MTRIVLDPLVADLDAESAALRAPPDRWQRWSSPAGCTATR